MYIVLLSTLFLVEDLGYTREGEEGRRVGFEKWYMSYLLHYYLPTRTYLRGSFLKT